MPALRRLLAPPLRHWLIGLVAAVAAGGVWWRAWGDAHPIPVSDEGAHLNLLLRLADRLAGAQGASWWHILLFSPESYPQLPYVVALPYVARAHGLDGVRQAWLAITVVVALLIGRMAAERVGGLLAIALVLTLTASPMALAYSHLFMLDYPLYLSVALTLFALDWSEGFGRPERLWAVVLGTVGCMLSKWTGALFLALPLLLAGLVAMARGPGGWGRRVATGVGVAVLLGLLAAGVWELGAMPQARQAGPNGPLRLLPIGSVAAGLALLAIPTAFGAVREKLRRTPLFGVLLVGVAVVLICGPWYVLVHDALLARREHEAAMLARAGDARRYQIDVFRRHLVCIVPFASAGIGIAGVAALLRPRGLLPTAAALASGFGAAWYLNRYLPFDPRYYLPTAALVVGAYAAAFRPWGGWVRGAAAIALVAALVPTTFIPLSVPVDPAHAPAIEPGDAGINFRLVRGPPANAQYRRIAVGAFTRASTAALLDAVADLCAGRPCTVMVSADGPIEIQARAIEALGTLRGLRIRGVENDALSRPETPRPNVKVVAACPGPSGGIPLGGTGCSVAVVSLAGS